MARITVTLEADEALFCLAALDAHSAKAHAETYRLIRAGLAGVPEFDIADVTARKCDAAHRAIARALYPETRFRGDWDDVPVAAP